MSVSAPFKLAVPDSLFLHEFDVLFRAVLSWGHIVFLFRVHGHEFNSFRCATRSKRLRQFQLRPIEAFLYHYRAIDLWEWGIRLLDELGLSPAVRHESRHSWLSGPKSAGQYVLGLAESQ